MLSERRKEWKKRKEGLEGEGQARFGHIWQEINASE
jgi:hypothetical protein